MAREVVEPVPGQRRSRTMSYTLPADVDDRPVLIDGAGTLGRRLAAVFAAGGSDHRSAYPIASFVTTDGRSLQRLRRRAARRGRCGLRCV
jgi:hypothetical protein